MLVVDTQWFWASVIALFGLLIGSFLNVVVYRLPKMLERQWADECAEMSGTAPAAVEPFNLMLPRSRCPHCGHVIAWYENIPVLSYVALRGRCAACKAPISLRYPVVELATSAVFFWCAWQWGPSASGLAWCTFSAALLTLALIDWDTTLLPDDLTLPLLWLGLIAAALRWTPVGLNAALWGAVAGYLSLWLVYWAFKLATGKEGMGYGDFKLFAALGAWFGWQALIPIILLASVIGAVVGIAMKFTTGLREGGYVPFGPFLAGAGFAALFLGPDALRRAAGL
ncbi:prepilin peptidase [Rhodoferax sp. AJA081-3]|uniref:prepilin peptidase n=1 Tax=Rhodoferax sp. AJA081-3 TaxID=2752316 RepID=UPI001AE0A9D0|nr:A24 family peptidase [Rhodoferax sp. AJA081-3]QTN27725.1 prepilin peptidase [Rhodoferax sp. AJA081-3]